MVQHARENTRGISTETEYCTQRVQFNDVLLPSSCCQCQCLKPGPQSEKKSSGSRRQRQRDAGEKPNLVDDQFFHPSSLPVLLYMEAQVTQSRMDKRKKKVWRKNGGQKTDERQDGTNRCTNRRAGREVSSSTSSANMTRFAVATGGFSSSKSAMSSGSSLQSLVKME